MLRDCFMKMFYRSDLGNIVDEFYIPCLRVSKEYKRAVGYFTSESLSVAAKGICEFINNGGVMSLIASPNLKQDDIEAIYEGYRLRKENIDAYLEQEILKINEDDVIKRRLEILSYLVLHNQLNIKIAIPQNKTGFGVYHEKIGIFIDDNSDMVAFTGSPNETYGGMISNFESIDVFCSWFDNERVINKFNNFINLWNNKTSNVNVIDFPESIKGRFASNIFMNTNCSVKDPESNKSVNDVFPKFRDYQLNAINAWFNNSCKGIISMATGTGKTFTALGCLNRKLSELNQVKPLISVIASPYSHLSYQWKKEINKIGINYKDLIIADSTNNNWRHLLEASLIKVKLSQYYNYYHLIILTTHKTLASEDFIKLIGKNNNSDKLLIVDEVHGAGSENNSNGLKQYYDYRLGLSATPERYFDEEGTKLLFEYFGNIIYEYNMTNAIKNHFLTEYYYYPYVAYMDKEEIYEYKNITTKIVKMYNQAESDIKTKSIYERLVFQRADLIKCTKDKLNVLKRILNDIKDKRSWTIIYCDDEQIDHVMKLLGELEIIAHKFTMEENAKPTEEFNNCSERQYLIDQFSKGTYEVLVAIKCLDEGIDIPPARNAILMSSSKNSREYIQRMGRVLRKYPGKRYSNIYDLIVSINNNDIDCYGYENLERKIFENEMKRAEYIAMNSNNYATALCKIYEIKGD